MSKQKPQQLHTEDAERRKEMPNPTPEQVEHDPMFQAIWQVIKSWDVNVPEYYSGYCEANGSHVVLILNALNARVEEEKTEQKNQHLRPHTKDEMELALRRFERIKEHLVLLPDDDDPLVVLSDVITELLEKRQSIAGVTSYMQQWLAEHTRR